MALLFLDGFDKYGGLNSNVASVQALLQQEWTSATGSGIALVAGLSATGFALQASTNIAGANKTLPGNYSRLIGGVRFSSNLAAAVGIQFCDGGTANPQASVTINAAGTIAVRNGAFGTGTILGTSTATISANSTHYLEWDITFSNTGSYQLWLDGVSILSGSGDTTATANSFANILQLTCSTSAVITWDDLYLFDTTGTTNNAVLLTSPRIETSFPNADGAVQFAVGAATLGSSVSRGAGFTNGAANILRIRPFTPSRNMTLNAVAFLPNVTNASINLRPVVYADSAGVPGSLLTAGSTVVGMTAATPVAMPLTTPQSLIAGTAYWLGYMCDISAGGSAFPNFDGGLTERTTIVTFSSGAPSTPSGLTNVGTTVIWGQVTNTGSNTYELTQPPQGTQSYVFDATVGHEDLYALPALSAPATAIYAVAVKANVAKSDAGAKTVSVRAKSGATDSAGSVSSFAPATTFGWLDTIFPTDPATGAAWTLTAVNAMQAGVKIET